MPEIPRLTLGFLLRAMRAGLAATEAGRVIVDFQQHTAEAGDADAPPHAVLRLHARVDEAGGGLDRAELSLDAPPSLRRLQFRRDGKDGYAYSIDGGRGWGRFGGSPRIFDLGAFEDQLDEVTVDDVTFEALPMERSWGQGEGSSAGAVGTLTRSLPAQVLDVSLDRAAFLRLLRIFAADLDEEEEPLALAAFSVSISAEEEVSLHCWWSLRGLTTGTPSRQWRAPGQLRITCSVSIRVAAIEVPAWEAVPVDDSLPLVGRVDDVWELLRRA